MHLIFTHFSRLCPVTITLAVYWRFGFAPEQLIFDKIAIAQGEWWRLLTGHFVHCDPAHLTLNLIGLAGLILLFDRLTLREICCALFTGIVFVDIFLWLGMTHLDYYCGLSGIENTLLVGGLASLWQHRHKRLTVASGSLAGVKIIYEINFQTALFSHITWHPIPEAHAAGFTAGIIWVMFSYYRDNQRALSHPIA